MIEGFFEENLVEMGLFVDYYDGVTMTIRIRMMLMMKMMEKKYWLRSSSFEIMKVWGKTRFQIRQCCS